MCGYWVSLKEIPEEGQDYIIEEQSVWQDQIDGFKLPYVILEPFRAALQVQVKNQGCLVIGSFTGAISLPCSRCAEPARCSFKHSFNVFEEFPDSHIEKSGPGFLRNEQGFWELDLGGILWEQFVLELPIKPLCKSDCSGLCPHCGANLNLESCTCEDEAVDPRMAIFKKIKIG